MTSAMEVLKAAIKAVPAVRYALGVAGVAAVVAIVGGLIEDYRVAVLGTVLLFALMCVLVVFANLTRIASSDLRRLALVLAWASVVLIVVAQILILTSFFFSWPKSLDAYLPRTEENISDQRRPAPKGLKRPNFRVDSAHVRIICGTNDVTKSRTELEQSALLLYSVAETPAIKVYVESGTLYVDASIFTGKQSKPLELKKNDYSRLPLGWDLNSTETALEIVNEQLQPHLQLIYVSKSEIQINGFFGNDRQAFTVFGKTMQPVSLATSSPVVNPIKRLFKYPSSTYAGDYQ